ncbi:MAG: salicylaldehyde dehydrogenase [Candidatus Roseilinea sp.]|nr:MAG: salicylaldehyde dehydrogenase [Candidatus Roseilinea sp.]
MRRCGLFINGREVAAHTGETFASVAPETGAMLGYAARAAVEDVDAAVSAAQEAFERWAAQAPGDRERILLRCADAVEAAEPRLLDLVIDESGSTISKARYEVRYSATLLRAAAGEARRLYGDTFPNDRPHRLSLVMREPLGVVGVIAPFNAPLVLLVKMIAFALASGNTIVAKPSEETPLIAVELARVLHAAGLPAGVLNVVTGYGNECGEPLVRHRHVRGIAFTGSTATGARIAAIAAPLMKRLQLELGGKNPLVVLRDVDVDRAAESAAVGAFYHAGQICMSSSRIIVERPIARLFAEALARKANALHLGDLRDDRTAYGPLIHARAVHKVDAHVRDAVERGATLLCGGSIHHGNTYQPTVLFEPPRAGPAWCDETFGPVVSIVGADDLDEAVAIANDSQYGLSAGVLTNDLQRGMTAARRIRAGSVHVGTHSFWSDALAPIGGYGMSGIGRSGGKYSVEHFTELKWMSLELGETPRPF